VGLDRAFGAVSQFWWRRGFLSAPPAGNAYTQVLWTWIDVAGFQPQIAFYLDALSLVMVLVVTCVGFLIHIYSPPSS
jgi:NADH-quinone oxidoreductase subunit L